MMTKLKFILIPGVIIFLLTTSVLAQDGASKLTLQNCLDIAMTNNIAVKQVGLVEQSAQLNLNQAKYNRLPNIAAGINYGINSGRSIDPFTNSYNNQQLSSSNANLTASVPVFRGFQTNNAIKQESFNFQAAKMELQQEKDNLTLNVILAFLQMMNDEDVLKQTREQMAVTQKQVERLTVLNNEGAIAPAALYDMKGQVAADQVSLVNAGRALEMSKLNLAQLMNVPYTKEMQIDRQGFQTTVKLYDATAANVYSKALQSLAMVQAADLRTKAATKAIKIATAGLYPTISLFGQLGTNYSSAARTLIPVSSMDVATSDYVVVGVNNYSVMTNQTKYNSQKISFTNQYNNNLSSQFGVSLSIPVFSSMQTRTNIKLAKLEEKRIGYIAENTRLQLKQSIEQAHLDMSTAFEKYNAINDQVAAYEESFRAVEIRFNLGAVNSVEYIIIKNNLDRANINLTVARYEYLLRTKVLDFYQGELK